MKRIFLLSVLSVFTYLSAQAQLFQWAKSQPNALRGPEIVAGANLLVATGPFAPSITLGGQTMSTTDSSSFYLAAYNLSGNVLWAKHIISQTINTHQITMDANQNIIVSGIYSDSLFIDGLLFKTTPAYNDAYFLVKFNAAGTLLWARTSSSAGIGNGVQPSLSTDANGNIFLAGIYSGLNSGSITFGNTTLPGQGLYNGFVAKYDLNGKMLWAKKPNTMSFGMEMQPKVSATASGDVYYSYLNNSPIAPEVGIKIHKLNANGTQLWEQIANINPPGGSSIFDFDFDLTSDDAGFAYVTGNNPRPIMFSNGSGNWTTVSNNNGTPLFIAKLSPTGYWKWARLLATGTYFSGSPSIHCTLNNELAIAGHFSGTATFIPNQPISTGPQVATNSFIASLDTAGTVRWTNMVTGVSANANSGLTSDGEGNFYLAGHYFTGTAHFGTHQLSTTAFQESYLAKINNDANQVNGTVFIDKNGNGLKDSNELPYSDQILGALPTFHTAISGLNGDYRLYLPSGNHTLGLPNPPRHYSFSPQSNSVSFASSNQAQYGKDFALQPIPNQTDVSVTVTNMNPARAGRTLKYQLTYRNVGTTTLSDSLTLTYNAALLSLPSATVTPVVQQPGKLKWVYQNLQPNEARSIEITLTVATNATMNTPLLTIANIKPFLGDQYLPDNADTLKHLVVASYDPNDKLVDKPIISPATAVSGRFLEYTIRFQNTGTDTAFTVVVTDPISNKLSLNELEMVAASHPYSAKITGINTLEWHFNNILLPDSTTNERASHGFIRFRIKTKPGLVLGDSIANQAAIFFDLNPPVMTNYAVTKIANPLGIKNNKPANLQAFNLYPNPARNYVIIASEFKQNTAATVSLVNMLGQTISKVSLPANNQIHYQMPLKDLPKGVYLVQLETEAGMKTQRLIVQ